MTWCSDPWRERRDGERAYDRGYLTHDERDRYRYPETECDEEFRRGYRDAERRAEERREEEARAERAEAQRRSEAAEYERAMEAQRYEDDRYYEDMARELDAREAEEAALADEPASRPAAPRGTGEADDAS